MRIDPIPAGAFPDAWEWVHPLIAKAIALDPDNDENSVLDMLQTGEMGAFRVSDGARGVVVLQMAETEAGRVLHLCYAGGKIDGGPRERLTKMRLFEQALAEEAKRIGCVALEGGGRRWHRFLPGWHSDGGDGPNSLRKVL